MAFGKKKTKKEKANTITLISITSGHSYTYQYNPNYPPSQNLERFIKEFDDEGFPMFFAEKKIPNLPVRVRSPDIEARMEYYKLSKTQRNQGFKPSVLDTSAQAAVEAQSKKAKNKKAAKAVRPSAKKEGDE